MCKILMKVPSSSSRYIYFRTRNASLFISYSFPVPETCISEPEVSLIKASITRDKGPIPVQNMGACSFVS